MNTKIFYSILFLLIAFNCYCQNSVEQKIDSLYDLAWKYKDSQPDSALYFADMQRDLSQKSRQDLGLVNSFYISGLAYFEKFYFDKAATSYFKGLDISNRNTGEEFQKKKLYLLQCLGVVYHKTYNYDNSIKYTSEALDIAKKINYKHIEELYFNLGDHYWEMHKTDSALRYYTKSIETSRFTKNNFRLARGYNAVGVIYDEQNKYKLGHDYFEKALEICQSDSSLASDKAMFMSNLGENYFFQNKIDKSINYYQKAFDISLINEDTSRIKWVLNNLADVYLREKNYPKAIIYYKNTIALGNPEVIDKQLQRAYKNISDAYKNLNKYELAFYYNSKYTLQTEKVISLKENLAEQNAQYRMKEVEWQRKLMLAQLEASEDRVLYLSIITALSLIILSYTGWRLFKHYRLFRNAKAILTEPISAE